MARLRVGVPEPMTADERPDALLYALALMIWTYVWRVQDLVSVLGALKLNLLATALALGLFVLDRHPARRIRLLETATLVCALALVTLAILGIPTSLWPRNSAMALAKELAPNVLLMVMLAAGIRGMRDLEFVALVTLLGGCVYSLFALLQFGVDDGGRFGEMVYYDANDLALVLLCTIPIAIYFVIRGGWGYRLLSVASLMLLAATFAGTGSRGGFLGLVAVLLFVLFGFRAISRRVRVLAVIGGLGAFSIIAGGAYWEKIRTLRELDQDYNWTGRAPEGRMEVWRRGLGYMESYPIGGVGLRNFQLAEGMLSDEAKARAERGKGFKWSVAHNSFIEVGVELGIPGLLVFLALLALTMRALAKIRRAVGPPDESTFRAMALACALIASLVGFIVTGVFVSAVHFSLLYVLVGLTSGLTKERRLAQATAYGWPAWASRLERARRLPALPATAFVAHPLAHGMPPRRPRRLLRAVESVDGKGDEWRP